MAAGVISEPPCPWKRQVARDHAHLRPPAPRLPRPSWSPRTGSQQSPSFPGWGLACDVLVSRLCSQVATGSRGEGWGLCELPPPTQPGPCVHSRSPICILGKLWLREVAQHWPWSPAGQKHGYHWKPGHHYCDTTPCTRPPVPVGPIVLLRLGLFPRPGMAISKGHRPGRAQGHLILGAPRVSSLQPLPTVLCHAS